MENETVVVFLDFANINRAAKEKRYRLDYQHLLEYIGEHRFLVEAYAYVPINPRNEHRLDGVVEDLWRAGYVVQTKMGSIAGGSYKCNFDVEMAMDVLRVTQQVKPNIIVLASGDADFVPLIQDIRRAGIRVEVAAFAETAGASLLLKCSGFIDLAVYYDTYLAAQQDEPARAEEGRIAELIAAQNPVSFHEPAQEKEPETPTVPAQEPVSEKEMPVLVVPDKEEIAIMKADVLDDVEL